MTPDDFRRIALELPEAVEGGHMGHADFRVGGKVFATLGYPDAGSGMVKLTLDQREIMMDAEPAVFRAVPGGWGAKGATLVTIAAADEGALRGALASAWRNTAPPKILKAHPL